jgi:hypothetical protein
MRLLWSRVWLVLCVCVAMMSLQAGADTLRANHPMGELHAFLLLRDDKGAIIGTGDTTNVRVGKAWKTRLTLHFKDGSLDDETAVYAQGATLRLISDHHVQKGPSYPKPMDMTIDVAKQMVTWHEFKDGKDDGVKTDSVKVPADSANGILAIVMQNLPKGTADTKVGYIAATPKPRVVAMAIHPDGQDHFEVGGAQRDALKYRIHIELGGVVGVIAPIIGKAPADLFVWTVPGEVQTFLRLSGQLAVDGPIWSIELSSPTWPRS